MQPIGRFAFSVESRFMPGINAQAIEDGLLGVRPVAGQNAPPQPTLMNATSFTHSTHFIEFSPLISLRAEAHMNRLT